MFPEVSVELSADHNQWNDPNSNRLCTSHSNNFLTVWRLYNIIILLYFKRSKSNYHIDMTSRPVGTTTTTDGLDNFIFQVYVLLSTRMLQ